MISTALNIGLTLALVVLLAINIWNVAYFFGLLTWFVEQLFNLTSYFWTSCWTITTVSAMFTSAVLLLIIVKIYIHLRPAW